MDSREELTIMSFILSNKKQRWLSSLDGKNRRKQLNRLAHQHDLDPRFMTAVPVNQDSADDIEALLRKSGAPDECYVMSESASIDRKSMQLGEALTTVVGNYFGALLVCIPGALAYYEGEDRERYILKRN